jgi:hypothetical protein
LADHIEAPIHFVNDWKHNLIKQICGWIKDLVGNSICVDTSCILGGIMISQKCGFQNPQTLMLSYQPVDNYFHMEIAHEELKEDITCLPIEFSRDFVSMVIMMVILHSIVILMMNLMSIMMGISIIGQ